MAAPDALDDPTLTIDGIVAFHAEERPDAPAVIEGGAVLRYAELNGEAAAMAAAFQALGLVRGDRVALIGRNATRWIVAAVAIVRAGLVIVAINTRLSATEIAFQIEDSGASLVLFEPTLEALAVAAAGSVPLLPFEDGEGGTPAWAGGTTSLPPGDGKALAAIFYTSGTTGRPKGAMLSHRNLLVVNQRRRREQPWDRWSSDDVCLLAMPFGHIGGFSMVLRTLFYGAAGVVMREFEAGAVLAAFAAQPISKMAAVPQMLQRIVEHPAAGATDFSRLRLVNHGAAPIEGELLAKCRCVIGCEFSQGYGMTETASVMASLDPAAHGRGLSASTGRALPGVELRIVGDDGAVLAAGAVGEIQVRGASVMQGYWRRPGEAPIDAEGWFATGDAGRLDEEGYLFIAGRIKDMIVSGGENIYPSEVEDAIAAHLDVADVAVIGMPDPVWGEAVHALVVLRAGHSVDAQTLIDWAKARIARFKAPKAVVFVDRLPRNALGKVLKHKLRAERLAAMGETI